MKKTMAAIRGGESNRSLPKGRLRRRRGPRILAKMRLTKFLRSVLESSPQNGRQRNDMTTRWYQSDHGNPEGSASCAALQLLSMLSREISGNDVLPELSAYNARRIKFRSRLRYYRAMAPEPQAAADCS